MIVTVKNGEIRIEALNDLEYVLKHIPHEVDSRKSRHDPATPLIVQLEVDGLFKKLIDFHRESEQGKAEINSVERALGAQAGEFSVGTVRIAQTFSVKMILTYRYTLGECTGKEVATAIRERMKDLTANGFVVKKLVLEGEEESTPTED